MKKILLSLLSVLILFNISLGQEGKQAEVSDFWESFSMKGSGVINYHNYNWQTDTTKRNSTDAERFNLYFMYKYTDKISMKTEIEVEAGGEVKLEQLNILFKVKPWLHIKAGRLKVHMGLASKLDEPTDYFTTYFSEMEDVILPLGWYENGIAFSGKLGYRQKLQYKLSVINGLDATAFSSRNWVKKGNQVTFETPNADALAVSGRLDYFFDKNNFIGWSGYFGNSGPNRPKTDLEVDAHVSITDIHFKYKKEALQLRGIILFGYLQNAGPVSRANRNLSNKSNREELIDFLKAL